MNPVNKFIKDLFDFSTRVIDTKKKLRAPLDKRIYEILTPEYLRLGKIRPDIEKMLRDKIKLSIKQDQPITLIIACGGFKGPRVSDSPHINWAEVFHISFLVQTLWEISQIHTPGLKLEFSGDDVIMPLLDNHKPEWAKIYNQEFTNLINQVQKYLPSNLVIINNPASNFYDAKKLFHEVEQEVIHTKIALPANKLLHAQNNFVFDGQIDHTILSLSEKDELLQKSVLFHHAWIEVDYRHRREYLEGGINIPVVHRKDLPGCYGIRSTKSSDVQFWEGYGVAKKKEQGGYFPSLLSQSRFLEVKSKIKDIKTDSVFRKLSGFDFLPTIDDFQ